MKKEHLLWVDDEIDLLRPHILFLEGKGYAVSTVTNGQDAIDLCKAEPFDLIFLDENMPGLSGLETLSRIKDLCPNTPVVMITKSEEENIMDMAIGSKIADYLIKPVNPNQILLTLKKNLHRRDIITEVANSGYLQEFGRIGMQINDSLTWQDWLGVYRKLVFWELELEGADGNMAEMLRAQKAEANAIFARFVRKNYLGWLARPEERPMMSPDLFRRKVFPLLDRGEKVFFILIDNFRYDQWRVIRNELGGLFNIEEELYCGILPTATQYARNAIFSGLMPSQIAGMFPDLWVDEDEEEGKNLNEEPLIRTQLERFRRRCPFSYHKVNDSSACERLVAQFGSLRDTPLNVVVMNFIDIMSHARTESKMMRELASTEAAYRSITLSWFRHSAVKDLFALLAGSGFRVIVTTDHGSIRVDRPVKIIGDRNTNTNLRYKLGKNLSCGAKQVFEVKRPEEAMLPCPNVSTAYVFATGNDFFAYPNNYNYYSSYYKDTFQHGGVSMEEMIIPLAALQGKK